MDSMHHAQQSNDHDHQQKNGEHEQENRQRAQATPPCTLNSLVKDYWSLIQRQGEPMSTGLPCLDDALGGGFLPQRLNVVVGPPSSGKTTLAHQIAYHVINNGRPVVYLSLEESPQALIAKTLSREFDLDYGKVLRGDRALEPQITQALDALSQRQATTSLRYLFNGTDRTTRIPNMLEYLSVVAKEHFSQYEQPGLIVVDYLQQLARGYRAQHPKDRRDLRECVGWMTDSLRQMARSRNCTVLVLSSQRRANGYGQERARSIAKESALSSAKESGDIEYDCDALFALKPAEEKREAGQPPLPKLPKEWQPYELEVAKNRMGRKDITLPLAWRGDRQMMRDAKDVAQATGRASAAKPFPVGRAKAGKGKGGREVFFTDDIA